MQGWRQAFSCDEDNRTADKSSATTNFRVAWDKDAILFEIVCHEPEMKKLAVSNKVHDGDHVIIQIETSLHSYYHLAINPDGAIVKGNPGPNWKSLAQVKTERGGESWSVRVRIPIVEGAEALSDSRHRVAGTKPTAEAPWCFNVGRHRVLDLKKPEMRPFSPTRAGWHLPERLGKLWGEPAPK